MQYLSVKNLEIYQHYKDRDPKWIKLYYSILDDEVFMVLDETMRCRYMTCLILASRTQNKIPADPQYLKKFMRLDKAPNLQPLLDHGFLVYHPSSIPLDSDKHVSQGPNQSLLSSPLLCLNSPKHPESDLKSTKHVNGLCEFPLNWAMTEDERAQASGLGLNPLQEFARFRDYHKAKGTKFKDWPAAWRNWTRKAVEMKEGKA